MTTTNEARRAPREAPPPAWWLRSHNGIVAEVTRVTARDERGRKLYRLWYPHCGVRGSQLWTLDNLLGLIDEGARWLKRAPKGMEGWHAHRKAALDERLTTD